MPAPRPCELLGNLAAAGLSVILTPERTLKVTRACALTDQLRVNIRRNKAQLVNHLDRQAANDIALSDSADPDTHATKPTKPQQGDGRAGFVGFVAHAPAPFQKMEEGTAEPATDPDRCCWPHSTAISTMEIDTLMSRVARFTGRGVSYNEAERLTDKLVVRDRGADDRRLSLECAHLQGAGRCTNWLAAGVRERGLLMTW